MTEGVWPKYRSASEEKFTRTTGESTKRLKRNVGRNVEGDSRNERQEHGRDSWIAILAAKSRVLSLEFMRGRTISRRRIIRSTSTCQRAAR